MLTNIRIVLVHTFHPGNIGQTARAMKTMGLSDLVLVNPRSFPHEEASRLAAGAEDIIQRVRVIDSLQEAVKDCVQVVGASARVRSLPLPHFDEPDLMAQALLDNARSAPAALVFGRERSGLTNEEIRCCSHQVTIPANPDYNILNLAQAVQVLAYELFRAWRKQPDNKQLSRYTNQEPLPTQEQLMHFQHHLSQIMRESGFLTQPHAQTEKQLQAMFIRIQPSRKELSLLRGLLSSLSQDKQK